MSAEVMVTTPVAEGDAVAPGDAADSTSDEVPAFGSSEAEPPPQDAVTSATHASAAMDGSLRTR